MTINANGEYYWSGSEADLKEEGIGPCVEATFDDHGYLIDEDSTRGWGKDEAGKYWLAEINGWYDPPSGDDTGHRTRCDVTKIIKRQESMLPSGVRISSLVKEYSANLEEAIHTRTLTLDGEWTDDGIDVPLKVTKAVEAWAYENGY